MNDRRDLLAYFGLSADEPAAGEPAVLKLLDASGAVLASIPLRADRPAEARAIDVTGLGTAVASGEAVRFEVWNTAVYPEGYVWCGTVGGPGRYEFLRGDLMLTSRTMRAGGPTNLATELGYGLK